MDREQELIARLESLLSRGPRGGDSWVGVFFTTLREQLYRESNLMDNGNANRHRNMLALIRDAGIEEWFVIGEGEIRFRVDDCSLETKQRIVAMIDQHWPDRIFYTLNKFGVWLQETRRRLGLPKKDYGCVKRRPLR